MHQKVVRVALMITLSTSMAMASTTPYEENAQTLAPPVSNAVTGGVGDVNGDGQVTIGDVFYLINALFASGPAPLAASIMVAPVFCTGGSVTLTAPVASRYLWNTGATTQTIVASTSGSYSVTVTNTTGSSVTSAPVVVTVNPLPVITSFTSPAGVAPGLSGTVSCAYTTGTSFSLTSSLGNSFSPSSSGSSTTGGNVTYNRDTANGPDTITLTVTGPCGTSSSTRVINDTPRITSFTANPTTIAGGTTSSLSFTIQNGSTWSLSSSIGNAFSQSSGTGSGTFTITYSAVNNTGNETVTLNVVGPGGTTSGTVSIKVN